MNKIKDKDKNSLKPFNHIIQICPICHKIDAYKGDNHSCSNEIQRQINSQYYD